MAARPKPKAVSPERAQKREPEGDEEGRRAAPDDGDPGEDIELRPPPLRRPHPALLFDMEVERHRRMLPLEN